MEKSEEAATEAEAKRGRGLGLKGESRIIELKLEKSLVYFTTALRSNEVVLEKLLRTELIKKYPEDAELLEEVIVENKQAIEMCSIYRDIMSNTTEAFASVISNNLNITMKMLTSLTVLLSVPTIIASMWGMNVGVPFAGSPVGFWIVLGLAVICMVLAFFIMIRKNMFK